MEGLILQDAIKLEERNWSNWLADAEKTRDRKLRELAADSAKKGVYLSGGRLKEDLRIIFESIDEVVTKAVTLRRTLAPQNPLLGETANITPLISKITDFINGGISQIDDQMSKTFRDSPPGARSELLVLANKEAAMLLSRSTNELENIPLELRLNLKKETTNEIRIQIGGNSNIVNLGTVLGDLSSSVRILNKSDNKDIADAVAAFGLATQESMELSDLARQESLEHLATVSEEAAKPPAQRRLATFTSATTSLGSIASVAMKLAPAYHHLMTLLTDHHILDR